MRSLSRVPIPYHILVLLGVLPLLGLAVFAYVLSGRAVEKLVRSGNDAPATITAAMVEREFGFWAATLTSHAGLGLSTVYGIVRQSGGHIWVYSEPGRGTTFKVYLPRSDDQPAASVEERAPLAEVAGTGLVLVVEGESGVRSLLARVLAAAGYDVLEAESAEKALALFSERAGSIDLVLTDVVLPDLSGPELVSRLEAQHGGGRFRVLYMSGYTDDAIVHHGVLDEGTEFIEKPLRPSTLLAKVQAVLGGSH